MRLTTFAALLLFLLAGAGAIPLQHACAQGSPPPAAKDAPKPLPQPAPPLAEQGATPPAPAAATSAPAAPSSTVTHSNVNLRGGPGTNYALEKLIPAGSPVEVKECKNGWCKVVFEGADGYIIETSLAPRAHGTAAKRRFAPAPGYAGPPPAYSMSPPRYYPPPPYGYYYYGPYYLPYWGWRGGYWRRW